MRSPALRNPNAPVLMATGPQGQSPEFAERRSAQAGNVADALAPAAAAQEVTAEQMAARAALSAVATQYTSEARPFQYAQAEGMENPQTSPLAQRLLEKHKLRAMNKHGLGGKLAALGQQAMG